MSTPELKKFGEKLHLLRTRRGLTLKSLAEILGMCTHSYLSEIESGKKAPTATIILGVARFFNVSTDALMKDEIDLKPRKPKA